MTTNDDSRQARFQEIMRRLAERQTEQARAPLRERQGALGRVLDDLDAWGKLEHIQRRHTLCWGPKRVDGLTPVPWVGVVIWRRGPGYHGYGVLQLTGVWAYAADERTFVTVGAKALPFAAPFYEAEAYHRLIRSSFDLYYRDDGGPPSPAGRRLDVVYEPEQRLTLRETIREALHTLAQ